MKKGVHPRLSRVARFLAAEDGPTAVEYAVMVALITVTCIGVLVQHGECISSVFRLTYAALGGS